MEERYTAGQIAATAAGSSVLLWTIITASALPDLTAEYRLSSFHPSDIDRVGSYAVNLGTDAASSRMEIVIGIALVLLAICAAILMYRSLAVFQRGIDGSLWSKAELDKVQIELNCQRWTVIASLMCLLAFCLLLFGIALRHLGPHHHYSGYGGFAYFWMSPLIALGTMRRALQPKRERSKATWTDKMKPIVSEHWGDRGPLQS